ncbi:MAG: Hsp33 family molecular chaperone HslO [Oligoflexus sp.]|jgi:molecular chaperone Hsp33
MARIKKYLSKDGTLRIAAVISTDLANEAFRHLEASPLAKTLMSRAITGAVLMASQMKEGLSLGLHFVGEGPIGSIFTEARYEGKAKVYAEYRHATLPEGETHIGQGLGQGRLEVIRSLPFSKEPHRGTVTMLTGEIGDDIAYYLQQSQQIPCIVALSAIPNQEGVELAGGYILELMPGYTDETITKLERLQPLIGSVTKKLQEGREVEDLIDIYLDHFDFVAIEHPYDLHYECGCNLDRVERSLLLLGPAMLDEMIDEREEAAINCEFCGKDYRLSTAELQRLRSTLNQQFH